MARLFGKPSSALPSQSAPTYLVSTPVRDLDLISRVGTYVESRGVLRTMMYEGGEAIVLFCVDG